MLRQPILVFLFVLGTTGPLVAQKEEPVTDIGKADADFAIQGEYVGEVTEEGKAIKYGIQVIAQSQGRFRAAAHRGGLPGDGWDKSKRTEADGMSKEGVTVFAKLLGTATIKEGVMTIADSNGTKAGELKRIVRQSPTLGAKPPEGALVLFDGSGTEHFPGAKMTDDKLLNVPATSKELFKNDFTLHVEFRIPYRSHGNSGVYLQGSYEIQLLNSFGKVANQHDCGAIYGVRVPDVNMTLPPLSWQTFDVDYVAPRFDADGKLVKNPVATVRHNGVMIHEKLELPEKPTGGGRALSPKGGPLFLQPYNTPVHFRNIWVVEKK
jgi:hypothetical protein